MSLHVKSRDLHDGTLGNAADFYKGEFLEDLAHEASLSGSRMSLQEVLENTPAEGPTPEEALISAEEGER